MPARTRVYGVGAAKTGTHSLGEMYADLVPSGHERDAETLIDLHLRRVRTGDDTELVRFLRRRDRERRLHVDASQVNLYLLDDLERLRQDHRYVQTVRSPVDWLRSIVDDSLRRDVSPTWHTFRAFRFDTGQAHPPHEQALADRGLWTLAGYLRYWRHAVLQPGTVLPPERVLVVRTTDLGPRAAEIATFGGIPEQPAAATVRSFENPTRSGALARLDVGYLSELVVRECGSQISRHFPELDVAEAVASLQERG